MIPDTSKWTALALERFQSTGLSTSAWPRFRDEFIVEMTRRTADLHQKEVRATWA